MRTAFYLSNELIVFQFYRSTFTVRVFTFFFHFIMASNSSTLEEIIPVFGFWASKADVVEFWSQSAANLASTVCLANRSRACRFFLENVSQLPPELVSRSSKPIRHFRIGRSVASCQCLDFDWSPESSCIWWWSRFVVPIWDRVIRASFCGTFQHHFATSVQFPHVCLKILCTGIALDPMWLLWLGLISVTVMMCKLCWKSQVLTLSSAFTIPDLKKRFVCLILANHLYRQKSYIIYLHPSTGTWEMNTSTFQVAVGHIHLARIGSSTNIKRFLFHELERFPIIKKQSYRKLALFCSAERFGPMESAETLQFVEQGESPRSL
jgi:hypothetical protein